MDTADKIASLESTVRKLQAANVEELQKQILQELYGLREALISDIKKLGAVPAAETPAVDADTAKRIKELEDENRKKQYRILHLTRNLKELL